MAIDPSILDKIAGLLQLAEKNSNANESASAAAAAQRLLTKYRPIGTLNREAGRTRDGRGCFILSQEDPGLEERPRKYSGPGQWLSDLLLQSFSPKPRGRTLSEPAGVSEGYQDRRDAERY